MLSYGFCAPKVFSLKRVWKVHYVPPTSHKFCQSQTDRWKILHVVAENQFSPFIKGFSDRRVNASYASISIDLKSIFMGKNMSSFSGLNSRKQNRYIIAVLDDFLIAFAQIYYTICVRIILNITALNKVLRVRTCHLDVK